MRAPMESSQSAIDDEPCPPECSDLYAEYERFNGTQWRNTAAFPRVERATKCLPFLEWRGPSGGGSFGIWSIWKVNLWQETLLCRLWRIAFWSAVVDVVSERWRFRHIRRCSLWRTTSPQKVMLYRWCCNVRTQVVLQSLQDEMYRSYVCLQLLLYGVQWFIPVGVRSFCNAYWTTIYGMEGVPYIARRILLQFLQDSARVCRRYSLLELVHATRCVGYVCGRSHYRIMCLYSRSLTSCRTLWKCRCYFKSGRRVCLQDKNVVVSSGGFGLVGAAPVPAGWSASSNIWFAWPGV